MSAAFDPVEYGLTAGPWMPSPDWSVFYSQFPTTWVEYALLVPLSLQASDTPTQVVAGMRYSSGVQGPDIYQSTSLVAEWDTVTRSDDSVQTGFSVRLSPNYFRHFQAEGDAEGDYYSLIWDDPNVCGIEIEGGHYVYLWHPVWDKESPMPVSTYDAWLSAGGEDEWMEFGQTTSYTLSEYESLTLPCRVRIENSYDGTVAAWTTLHPLGVGQIKTLAEPFSYWTGSNPYPGGETPIHYKTFGQGSVLYSGKQANSSSAPPIDTTVNVTIPADDVWRNVYGEWSVRVTGQGSYAPPPRRRMQAWANVSAPAVRSFLGKVTSPLRWRVLYGAALRRPGAVRRFPRGDGLVLGPRRHFTGAGSAQQGGSRIGWR